MYQKPKISDEAQAAWQRFLEALARRMVREQREKQGARKDESGPP
jgi:hypothetical protein